jgi:hypothetical protein
MLRRVALVRTDISEERSASIIKVRRIGELETTSAVTSNRSSATLRNITEDGIVHSHRRENLNSYIALIDWTLRRRCNVSSVRYELWFYIPEDGIFRCDETLGVSNDGESHNCVGYPVKRL